MPTAAPSRTEYKTVSLTGAQFKAGRGSDPGSLSGYVSVFGGIDAYGDTIIPGAYADTIPSFVSRGSLLFEHDSTKALGTIKSAVEDHHGLLIEAQFYTDADAQLVRSRVGERMDRGKNVGMSIGFVPEEVSFRDPRPGEQVPAYVDQVRELRKITLYEASIVAIPADAAAAVIDAKSGGTMNALRQRLASRGYLTPLPESRVLSLGQKLIASAEYKALTGGSDLRGESSAVRLRVEIADVSVLAQKALVTSINTPGALTIDQTSDGTPALLVDYLPTVRTTENSVTVARQTARPTALAVSEATASTGTSGTKQETSAAWDEVIQPMETISEWVPVTRQLIADAAGFEALIDSELSYAVRLALEGQVITGSGVRPNLAGIIGMVGVNTVAVGAAGALAAIAEAISQARKMGRRQPNIIVMDGDSWDAIAQARESVSTGTLGGNALGPPGLLGSPSLWGIPVIPSTEMAAGTAVVGATSTATVYERMGATIVIGTINTMFIRNTVAVRCEMRGALGVRRPAAWTSVSGLPTS